MPTDPRNIRRPALPPGARPSAPPRAPGGPAPPRPAAAVEDRRMGPPGTVARRPVPQGRPVAARPAPQPQAPPRNSNGRSWSFNGMDREKTAVLFNYEGDGRYIEVIRSVEKGVTARQECNAYTIKKCVLAVLAPGIDSTHSVGEEVTDSIVENKKYPAYFLPVIKAFVKMVSGHPNPDDDLCNDSVSEAQPFAGRVVEMNNIRKPNNSKPGEFVTKRNYVRRIFAAELETLVPAEDLELCGVDLDAMRRAEAAEFGEAAEAAPAPRRPAAPPARRTATPPRVAAPVEDEAVDPADDGDPHYGEDVHGYEVNEHDSQVG